ncbi:HIT family protein [Halapricum desulfuricans]|nr:HIT family protein [Halapricum desulfuricans]
MSDDCIFCRIVDGEIPSRTVYEDDAALAFLDANPLTMGHTLVVPKDHYERLDDIPAAEATDFYGALHEVVPAVEDALDVPATTVAVNNGEAAGQEVPHVHAHVVPRSADDGAGPIHALFDARPDPSDAELDDVAESIADRL